MLQVAVRAWPPGAVHDTVAAVMRTAPFRRSLSNTLLNRLVAWIGQFFKWLSDSLGGLPAGRTIVIWLTGLMVLLILARLIVSARARDDQRRSGWARGAERPGEDAWHAAERLAAAGDHEGAAHALYRGVVTSVAARERLRLDPSKTSGDYLRELRARGSGAYQPFRQFARRFDAAVYGHERLDAALVDELRRLALPMRGTARAA